MNGLGRGSCWTVLRLGRLRLTLSRLRLSPAPSAQRQWRLHTHACAPALGHDSSHVAVCHVRP